MFQTEEKVCPESHFLCHFVCSQLGAREEVATKIHRGHKASGCHELLDTAAGGTVAAGKERGKATLGDHLRVMLLTTGGKVAA